MADDNGDDADTTKRFNEAARKRLLDMFASEWQKANPDSSYDAATEAEIFVRCLEGSASAAWPAVEKQARRRERVEALANALDSLADVTLGMDDSSLGFAIYSGLAEMAKGVDYTDEDREAVKAQEGHPATLAAHLFQRQQKENVQSFCLGVRNSIRALPALDKNYTDEFQTAKFIEDYLGRAKIKVSESDTGLAGEAFIATMRLCGCNTERAGYWIKKAKCDSGSWGKFVARMSERITGDDDQKPEAE